MKDQKVSITTQAIIISVLLLAMNFVLGSVMLNRSKSLMKTLINERMLDIANTSAAMLDGNALKALRAEDKGTPPYEQAMDTPRVFQDNIDLEYIYGARAMEDGSFTFTVDPRSSIRAYSASRSNIPRPSIPPARVRPPWTRMPMRTRGENSTAPTVPYSIPTETRRASWRWISAPTGIRNSSRGTQAPCCCSVCFPCLSARRSSLSSQAGCAGVCAR